MERGLDDDLGFVLWDGAARNVEALGVLGCLGSWLLILLLLLLLLLLRYRLRCIELRAWLGCDSIAGTFGVAWWHCGLLLRNVCIPAGLLLRAVCAWIGVVPFFLSIVLEVVFLVLLAVVPVEEIAACDYL